MQAAEVRNQRPMGAQGYVVDRAQYRAPEQWRVVPILDLLAGTARANLGAKQVDWVNAVTKGDDGVPGSLFVVGETELLQKRCIAIIGARKASPEGRQRARQLAKQLASRGVVIVSGLADGIDTEALTAAIEAGGKVVAVIGTPLDQAYPAKNKRLQELIYSCHLLVSQFPSGQRVFPSNFPARNRTMATLSDASIVIEASDTSGTLHQAAECVRLGRWLGIANSVLHDPALTWPARFLDYPQFVPLESTDQLLGAIYGT
jgi:DNA processing protein